MYTAQEIKSMQQQAQVFSLKYPSEFTAMAPEALTKIINGYGPEHWHEELRKVLTWIFRHYPLPAAIHDVRYAFSDGMEASRKAADAEFAANLQLIWRRRYGRWCLINIFAWYDCWKIRTAARLVRRFSRGSWQEAYRRRKDSENE